MTLLLLVLLGVAIGLVLGALGGGGAILTVPALVFVIGQDASAASVSSLVIVGAAAISGAVGHVRAGSVDWRTVVGLVVAGIPAAWLGTHLSHVVREGVLLTGFSVLMLAAAAAMLRPPSRWGHSGPCEAAVEDRPTPEPGADERPGGSGKGVAVLERVQVASGTGNHAPWSAVVVAGSAVGFLTGFFGVGGGFVVVPALVLVLGLPMSRAVGTSLVIVAANSMVALAARGATAQFDWAVILPFAGAAVVAAFAGRSAAGRLPAAALRRGFAGLLVLVAAYTMWQGSADLAGHAATASAPASSAAGPRTLTPVH